MRLKRAIAIKLEKICNERSITPNKLASICFLTQSTIQNLITEKYNNPKLLTIIRICEGLNMPVKDFFDDEVFENIERED